MLYKGDQMKRTRTFICDFCEQKIKETEDVKTITVVSGKKRVCPFCFNFFQPRFYILHLIFIFIFLFLAIFQLLNNFLLRIDVIDTVIGYSYLFLIPIFLFFEIFLSRKKISPKDHKQ